MIISLILNKEWAHLFHDSVYSERTGAMVEILFYVANQPSLICTILFVLFATLLS